MPWDRPEWWVPFVAKMTDAGIGHWLVKVSDGVHPYNGYNLRAAADYAHGEGLHVWAWGYCRDARFDDPSSQGDLLGRRAWDMKANGVVLDVEREWLHHDPAAHNLAAAVRKACPGVPVFGSSYSTVSQHSDFPWEDFTPFLDGWMPQIYQTPQDEWALRSYSEFKGVGKGKDVILTGIGSGQMGTAADTVVFLRQCQALEVVCNVWCFEQMTVGMWEAVKNATAPINRGGGI